MSNLKIQLIWKPNFYKVYSKKIYNLNLNDLFWSYIFDYKKSSKIIKFKSLNKKEILLLKFLLPRLNISFLLLNKIKDKDIGIEKLFFIFNIINSYLKILNKFSWWVMLKFYNYTYLEDTVFENIENTIFYKFFSSELSTINSKLWKNNIIDVELHFSEQIIQLQIIVILFKKYYNKDIYFNIYLWSLIEFENKKDIEKILKETITNITNIHIGDMYSSYLSYEKIFGHKYYKLKVFNLWCFWRKCSFCNIWRYHKWILLEKNNIEKKIDLFIKYIKKEKISYISIADSSISYYELKVLSEKIIENWLDLNIHTRTRFTDKITKELCVLFWKAWIRYMWVWLESTSTRLNNLMNKYPKNYNTNDFQNLINNCKNTGINLHYYTIFWFPTEKKEEINSTRNFLFKNLVQENFFSYTAWTFWLNKWTEVYKNPDKYWIKIVKNIKNNKVFVQYSEKNYIENKQILEKTIKELNYSLFFNIDFKSFTDFNSFFKFIEHSHIFHIQKLKYNQNPYYTFLNTNKWINIKNFYKFSYKKSKYIQVIIEWKDIILVNWSLWNRLKIKKDTLIFFHSFDQNDNLENFRWDESIFNLIKNYFLIKKNND